MKAAPGACPALFQRVAQALATGLRKALPGALLCLGLLSPGSALAGATPADAPAPAESPERAGGIAQERWAGASFGWDVRIEGVALFKRYTLSDEEAWFSGQGAGGGATASLHFRPPAALVGTVTRWVELELGVGNSTHWVAWKEGRGPRSRSDIVHTQSSVIAGVHFASGRWLGDDMPWSGAVLGVAWLPSYVHFFGGDELASEGKFHPAGLRFTVDWGRIRPTAKGRVPGLRAVLTWLPYVNSLPTAVSAGVGCVFY